jgi:hypothetical protein
LSGANGWGSDGLGIRVFAELAGADHQGNPEPWTFAPALDGLKEGARLTWPNSLPSGIKETYIARSAQRDEARRAEQAAKEAERVTAELEAARAEGWPVP